MAKERNDFVDRLTYLALRVVSMLMHAWPVDLNLQAAKFIGDLMYAVDRKHRERRCSATSAAASPTCP